MFDRQARWLTLSALLVVATSSCSPPVGGDGDADLDAGADADDETDAGADADAEPQCLANGDHVIDAAEARPFLGHAVTYLVNAAGSTPTVDTGGAIIDDVLVWTQDARLDGDRLVQDEVIDPASRWFGDEFPEATYAQIVPGYEAAVGVYRRDDEGISLLGLASLRDESTLVRYDPPPFVVRFPLADGRSWTDETHAEGRVEHVAFNADETYAVAVAGAGEILVPAGRFPVLRVRTTLHRAAGPLSDQRVSYAWIAECWGRVAYAGSGPGVAEPGFTEAAEWWRLTIP